MTARKTVQLDREYEATPADVWEMWTTVEGIQAWWGPDGFEVEVHTLDLRPGGEMVYSMKAVAEEQRQAVLDAGMPTATTHSIVFTEVEPGRRLRYTNAVDFIPGVDDYDVGTLIELEPTACGTRLSLILDVMHDAHWTQLATAGWEQELEKLRHALRKDRS